MLRVPTLLKLTLCLIAAPASAQIPGADGELAVGLAAQEKGDYERAFQHLQRAVVLDPGMIKAHFALATVADHLCLPNAEPGPDTNVCGIAVQEYEKVPELDASRQDALKSLAYLLYQFNRVNESEVYYRRDYELNENDPEAMCALAALDFRRVWVDLSETRVALQLPPGTPLVSSPACNEVRGRIQPGVGEGIALLLRAVRAIDNDSDLKEYLSAFYMVRSQIQCGNSRASSADIKTAKAWSRRAKHTSQTNAQQHSFTKCPPAPPPAPDRE